MSPNYANMASGLTPRHGVICLRMMMPLTHSLLRLTSIRGLLLLLLLPLLGCGNFSNTQFHSGTGIVQGTLSLPDGTPARLAQIQIVNLPNLRTTTDQHGTFILKDVPAGRREIIAIHQKNGARIAVWIVGGKSIDLESKDSVLPLTGEISGTIEALHRFGGKGIKVTLKGTPYSVETHNHAGEFRLSHVPAGCHTLSITTPLFSEQKLPQLCIEAAQHKKIDASIVLTPSTPCTPSNNTCAKDAFCREGFCVPDQGGELQTTQGPLSVGTILLKQERLQQVEILKNAGPGRLHIQKISLKQQSDIFQIKLPKLPLVLQPLQSLSLEVSLFAKELGIRQAILEINTNDPQHLSVQKILHTEIKGHTSNCLETTPNSLDLGQLNANASHHFQLSVFNRCGTPQTVSVPTNSINSFPKEAGFTPIQLQTTIPPGRSVELEFDLLPQVYGSIQGEIQLKSGNIILYVPVKALLVPPGKPEPLVWIQTHQLDFGLVAPGETRKLWLHMRFATPPTPQQLKEILPSISSESQVRQENTQPSFVPLSGMLARTTQANRDYYIPIQYTAPAFGSLQTAWLKFSNLPGLQGKSYLLQLRGTVAPTQMPILPAHIDVGATQACDSEFKPITLTNKSAQPIIVDRMTLLSATPQDFVLRSQTLPFRIPPQQTSTLGWVQFQPKNKTALRTFAQLRVEMSLDGSQLAPQIISLRASSGFPLYETFTQADAKKAKVSFYIDPKTERLPHMNSVFLSLLTTLQTEKIDFQISSVSPTPSNPPIYPYTPDPLSQLLTLLSLPPSSGHQGLSLMMEMLQKQDPKVPSGARAIVLISHEDDRSPYAVRRYLPKETQDPFAIFAAVPHSSCNNNNPATRYLTASSLSKGEALDLCSADQAAWQRWTTSIGRFLIGQRVNFPLSQKPTSSSIQLQNLQHILSPSEWTYDDKNNRVTLSPQSRPAPGQTLTISYYTACHQP